MLNKLSCKDDERPDVSGFFVFENLPYPFLCIDVEVSFRIL